MSTSLRPSPPNQIAHHNPVSVSFADRNLVDTNRTRRRRPRTRQLRTHVAHLQRLHRLPVQPKFPRDRLDRRVPATLAHVPGEPFDVKRILRQKRNRLGLHLAALHAIDAPNLELKIDAGVATGQIPYLSMFVVVPAALDMATDAAGRFFERRTSVTTRACGS